MEKDIDYLFEKKLLRKIPLDIEKVKSSIKIADMKLTEAKELFDAEFFSNALLSVYTSMFHASRALLYKNGVQEKSHYAVYMYIKEIFSDKIPKSLINSLNSYREMRHNILYGEEAEVERENSENALLDAEDFLEEVKKILENGK
ncbi:MAG: HEPN domain-containing protein [Nanoarchaeota archaeon]